MKIITLVVLCLVIVSPNVANTLKTDYLTSLADTQYHKVDAKRLNRPFHIYVRLPDGHGTSQERYPTLYLLDGGITFPLLASYYRYLRYAEDVPKMILVGISYGSDNFEGGNYRGTDFTAPSKEAEYYGGAKAFTEFLANELTPMIEKEYQSDANRRLVFGQSLGGQYALYAANHSELFYGHIASNPALHRNLDFFLPDNVKKQKTEQRVFVSSGEQDYPEFREPALAWMKAWNETSKRPWNLKMMDLPNQNHFSAAPSAFRYGVRWLMADKDSSGT